MGRGHVVRGELRAAAPAWGRRTEPAQRRRACDNYRVIASPTSRPALILASTSAYRHALLQRLQLPFEALSPQVDESPRPGESCRALAERLALAKAHAVARSHPQAIVIGSDQVADLQGRPLGKPGTRARAAEQLSAMSGQKVVFHTALAVVRPATGFERVVCVPVTVHMRSLSAREIEAYLDKENALDCAGSAKSEGLGIALMQALSGDDPTALVGLPLIQTAQLLREAGLDPLLS